MLPFTGHNIVLDDGRQTLPGITPIADTGITQAALRMLSVAFPAGPDGVTVADLGCLEGGYAVAFARAGYTVVGVEARRRNLARCVDVQEGCPSLGGRLIFVQADARLLPHLGDFDAVFCAGLLYHLDDPVTFLGTLGGVTRRLLMVQTHISLTPQETHEGTRGHWYRDSAAEEDAWGSHGNTRSWWMTLPDLLASIRGAGFPLVVQQFDYLPDIAAGPQGRPEPSNPTGGADRVLVAGVKP